jgi:hypothetical protein
VIVRIGCPAEQAAACLKIYHEAFARIEDVIQHPPRPREIDRHGSDFAHELPPGFLALVAQLQRNTPFRFEAWTQQARREHARLRIFVLDVRLLDIRINPRLQATEYRQGVQLCPGELFALVELEQGARERQPGRKVRLSP